MISAGIVKLNVQVFIGGRNDRLFHIGVFDCAILFIIQYIFMQ